MDEYSNRDEYGEEYDEMEPYTVKSAGIKYGIYLGIVSVVLALVQFMSDGAGGTPLILASLGISIVAVVIAHNEFKRNNDGFMSYSEGLGIGVLLTVISGGISGLFGILYRTVIDPGFTERTLEHTRQTLEDSGLYTDAQIEQTMTLSQQLSSPAISFLIGIVAAAFLGLIISLIVSAFTKNKRPLFD